MGGRDVTTKQVHVITDDATQAEIAEALTHLARYAGRLPHHWSCVKWNDAHAKIDLLLADWEAGK